MSTTYRGKIERADPRGVYVSIPDLGGATFGPLEIVKTDTTLPVSYQVGDRVIVQQIGSVAEDLIVIGHAIRYTDTPWPSSESNQIITNTGRYLRISDDGADGMILASASELGGLVTSSDPTWSPVAWSSSSRQFRKVSGPFHTNQIPNLDAAKTTSGVFDKARIPAPGSPVVRVFTSTGSWIKPAGLAYIRVRVQGGGGAGGGRVAQTAPNVSGGGGGGAGGYTEAIFLADTLTNIGVTVGDGGAGSAGGGGNAGGQSRFGPLLVANGGEGGGVAWGASPQSPPGGTGGGTSGDGSHSGDRIAISGQHGAPGFVSPSSYVQAMQGSGGDSFLGAGGVIVGTGRTGVTAPGSGYGGGGSGNIGGASAGPGGNGAPGVVIVEEFYL